MKKSKFKTFILSIIPGLGHIYVGAASRGFLMLFSFICYLFIGTSLDGSYYFGYYHRSNYLSIIIFATALLWFYCQYDAQRIRNLIIEKNLEGYDELSIEENKKTLAIILSVVPGAGHIYAGFTEKGAKLLALFFGMYLLDFLLPIRILSLFIALIVIYSIINLYDNINSLNNIGKEELHLGSLLGNLKGNYMTYIGVILIICGLLIIANRIALEFIDRNLLEEVYRSIREAVASLVLIGVGIKLITSNKLKGKV